jgi:hypothetical protein
MPGLVAGRQGRPVLGDLAWRRPLFNVVQEVLIVDGVIKLS